MFPGRGSCALASPPPFGRLAECRQNTNDSTPLHATSPLVRSPSRQQKSPAILPPYPTHLTSAYTLCMLSIRD